LGVRVMVLGGCGTAPKPQPPLPNPQSPIPNPQIFINKKIIKKISKINI